MIKVENVSFGYLENQPILQNINFQIKEGEIIGIVGPSGYGKSTLAKIIAGVKKPDKGRVTVDGRAIKDNEFCPVQLIYQHPEKSLNPKWKMEKSLNECYEPDKATLKNFGIKEEWLSRWPIELSGGELQRFCLLRVLSPQVKYLVADEISTMLDAISQAQIWKILIKTVKERNLGLVIISHNKGMTEALCDKVIDITTL